MTVIDTVIFDIGNVLYRWDPRFLYEKLIADKAQLDWFLSHVVTHEWHFQHDAGRPIAEMIAERIAQFPDHAEWITAYALRWLETIPGSVPGSLELVAALAARGVPLYAITNFGADFWAMFRPTAPVFDHFRDIVVSGAEKMLKPDPAIYRLAIDRFAIDPARALFIDDRQDNVEAARGVGLNAYHFTDAAALDSTLRSLGLL